MDGNHGPAIAAALSEAMRKFGKPNPHNREQIARYVKRRVHELAGDKGAEVHAFHPREFDAEAKAEGDE